MQKQADGIEYAFEEGILTLRISVPLKDEDLAAVGLRRGDLPMVTLVEPEAVSEFAAGSHQEALSSLVPLLALPFQHLLVAQMTLIACLSQGANPTVILGRLKRLVDLTAEMRAEVGA